MHSNKSLAAPHTHQLLLLLLIGLVLQLSTSALAAQDYSQYGYYHYPAPTRAQQHSRQQQQQVARQFAAPALDHVAFTQALTSQGYVFGGHVAAASAPLTAAQPATGRAIASSQADSNSLNLKLPVPFGVMPLNVAHLPLQAGAAYSTVPRTTGLTSYGTAQLQRR